MHIDDYNLHRYLLMMIIIFSVLKRRTMMVLIIFYSDYKSVPDRSAMMVKNDNYFLMCQNAA